MLADAPGESKGLLEVTGLSVGFRTPHGLVHALRDVSLSVPRRRVMGIVGESGSGKSTLVWAVSRLLASNAVVRGGEIRVGDTDVLGLDEATLQQFRGGQVSIVFQDPMTSQIPVLSYLQQMLDVQRRLRDRPVAERRKRATDWIRDVGIPDPTVRVGQYPFQFSGGMRQRAAIAMALLLEPPLVFLDEPTTALDVTLEAQIVQLLRQLNEQVEATLVLVSHNLGLIASLCDSVAVMYAGEIVESGSVEQIFHAPKHPYTRALLDCDPARSQTRARRLPTISGEVPDLQAVPAGCAFAPRCPNAAERCRTCAPELKSLEDGRKGRCHFAGTLADPVPAAAPTADPAPRPDSIPTAGPVPTAGAAPDAVVGAGPADPTGPLLDIRNLRVRFRISGRLRAFLQRDREPFVDAVLGANLSLQRGGTVGLIGESGSGKTTLGRSVLGLLEPSEGSIVVDGRDVGELSAREWTAFRRHLAMIFQDPVGSLSPRKTVRSLLAEPFHIHGGADGSVESAIRRLCEMVQLPAPMLDRYPHELSGGQARRVGVARALALEPSLVVADEPTAGLDVSVQGEILNLLAELREERGLSYLLVSHNLPAIRHICDRLAIMYLGRIVERGPCEAVFRAPAHPYTDALIRGIPRPDPAQRTLAAPIQGEIPSPINRPSGCEFRTRCPHATPRCTAEIPVERAVAPGREVRCHHPLVGNA